MTLIALALGIAQATVPKSLHARVISASIFKPGLAMLVREVEVPAGSGFYSLDGLPEAIDGSFWFGSPDGVEISDVDTAMRLTDETRTYDAKTIPELIFANVGKHLSMKIGKNNGEEALAGVLTDFDPASGGMTLKLDNGNLRTFGVGSVLELDPTGLTTSYTRSGKLPTLKIQFHAQAPKPAHVRFMCLETGVAWVASYRVDLGPDNFAIVGGKAQIGLAGVKFENTDTKLMAGFPTLPTNPKHDLASGYGPLESYLRNAQDNNFLQFRPGERDPYDLYAAWVQAVRQDLARYGVGMVGFNYRGGFAMGGGFGGGGFGDIVANNPSYYRSDSGQLLPNDVSMARVESLYAYPIGPTNLEPGDRMTKLLFEQRSPYRVIYRWEAIDAGNPVEQILRIHNEGKTPWTGGLATIVKSGLPLSQLDMPFTAIGRDANLTLGKAPDIVMDSDTTELKAEAIMDPKRTGVVKYQKLTEERKISAENTKDEPITLEINLILPGEIKTDGAKMEKLPRRHGEVNPQTRITWQLQLAAGESKRVSVINTYLR